MRCLCLVLATLLSAWLLATPAQAQESVDECPNPEGWKPTEAELDAILKEHAQWLEAEGWKDSTIPGKANFCEAILSRASLSEANLSRANLNEADLSEADLMRANLTGTDLRAANLAFANLRGADLAYSNLKNADLFAVDLAGATLFRSDLRGANLADARLTDTDLSAANLQDADLSRTLLRGAQLRGTILQNAKLTLADLSEAYYSPRPAPPHPDLYGLRGLTRVVLPLEGIEAFSGLRTLLKQRGLHGLAREATFNIEYSKTRILLGARKDNLPAFIEGSLRLIFFEWTNGYGLFPFRSLYMITALVLLLAPIYFIALKSGKIFRIWPDGHVRPSRKMPSYEIYEDVVPSNRIETVQPKDPISSMSLSLYFSLLSAFRIGWGSLNISIWLEYLQAEQYELRAVGWPRVLAGIQSWTSLYLLLLAVGKFFGLDIDWDE